MNQILVNEKVYVTPELKRKKKFFKIEFFLSVFLLCLLFSYYIYAEYDKYKSEEVSKKILSVVEEKDTTMVDKKENDVVIVILNATNEQQQIEEIEDVTPIVYTENGIDYKTIAQIVIPKINVNYPVLETTDDRIDADLKVSPCKFWGPNPNETGNFCIVGHNYRNTRFFSKVPDLEKGDTIELTSRGKTIIYEVYDKYVVDPDDRSCTSQKTNGRTELTLITCTNDSKNRVIVKAKSI